MSNVLFTRSATQGTNTEPRTGESAPTPARGPTNYQRETEALIAEKTAITAQCPTTSVTGGESLPPIQQLKNLVTKDLTGSQGQYLLKITQPFSPSQSEGEVVPNLSELEGVKEILQEQRRGVKRCRPGQELEIQVQNTKTLPREATFQWKRPPPPPPVHPPVATSTSCERIVAEQRDIATRLAATLNHLQEKVTYLYSDHYGICSYLNEADRSTFCKGKQQIQEIVTQMQRAQSTAQEAYFVTSETQFYKELHQLETLHRKSKLNHLYGTIRY